MKALIQRVTHASVSINQQQVASINHGLVLLLGCEKHDTQANIERLIHKVLHYRVFSDELGKMNLNIQQVGGAFLVVSQFTLVADTKKGNRPGFSSGASPEQGLMLYNHFVEQLTLKHPHCQTGRFGADMQVSLCNDGPVTFMLEG